jgi:hypothetical protein
MPHGDGAILYGNYREEQLLKEQNAARPRPTPVPLVDQQGFNRVAWYLNIFLDPTWLAPAA